MHHLVYKITNLLNGKIYIGKHSTSNIDDGYFGSSKTLKKDIAKFGLENFKKEILADLPTVEDAFLLEENLVDEEFVLRKDTYNKTTGGKGGWQCVNSNEEFRKEKNKKAAIAMNKKNWSDPKFAERVKKRASNQMKKLWKEGKLKRYDSTGKKISENHKKKIGKANAIIQKGEKNSNYGKVWIYSLIEKQNKSVLKEELESWIEKGWQKGRKMKFD